MKTTGTAFFLPQTKRNTIRLGSVKKDEKVLTNYRETIFRKNSVEIKGNILSKPLILKSQANPIKIINKTYIPIPEITE